MFQIKTKTETILTDFVVFIRRHPNGCLVQTTPELAEGVATHGTPYMFEDGVSVNRQDTGHILMDQSAANTMIEEALCEKDVMDSQRMTDIENALCELDAASAAGK